MSESFDDPQISYPLLRPEVEELHQKCCDRCGKVTDKLYRMGTACEPMSLCSSCRSEFVGE